MTPRHFFWTPCALVLAACGGGGGDPPAQEPPPPPPAVQTLSLDRYWQFEVYYAGSGFRAEPLRYAPSGVVHEEIVLDPPSTDESDDGRKLEVHSNADGVTYWLGAESPRGDGRVPETRLGASAWLRQQQVFRKLQEAGTLEFVVTHVDLEAFDGNPVLDENLVCGESWMIPALDCSGPIWAKADLVIEAFTIIPGDKVPAELWTSTLSASLDGSAGRWRFQGGMRGESERTPEYLVYGTVADFDVDLNVDRDATGTHARVKLNRPITITIPLKDVKVDELVWVDMEAFTEALNQLQLESWSTAFFRDPLKTTGVTVRTAGMEPVPMPAGLLPPQRTLRLPQPCPATDPAAGIVEFAADRFSFPESFNGRGAPVRIVRHDGSRGKVAVTFSMGGGTATSNLDYMPVTRTVVFGDGEEGTKWVRVPLIPNTVVDGDRWVEMRLSAPLGCAALGRLVTSQLKIRDDDTRPVLTYTVGGTVNGLAGTGLTVGNAGSSVTINGDGRFTIPTPLPDGTAYDVRVLNQPGNPAQQCTVQRGGGTIAGANVTDVQVQCAAPLPNGALDPTFGSAGKVSSSSLTGGVKAMAVQNDGKTVLLSGTRSIVRYLADGALDAAFGSNGVVTVGFSNGADTARALALQADGKIVVAGRAVGSGFDDFGITRLNADGSLDTGFGTAGKALVDLSGGSDDARAVLVQDDGRIVVVGSANTATPTGADSDFAAVRLHTDGTLDAGFGSGGRVRVGIAGKADIASAAALRPDGGIVIVGRAATDGGALPDTGLVVLSRDGVALTTLRFDLLKGGEHDEAVDVLVQPDGRILLAIALRSGGLWRYVLARRQSDGAEDSTFGGSGHTILNFAVGGDFARALALQSDGRIVAAGITRPSVTQTSEVDDFVITRHRVDGTLDTTFGTGGAVKVDFFGSSDGAECVSVLADGRIVASGLARNASTNGLALVRLLP